MKSLALFAVLPLILATSSATAGTFQLVHDPSGAPMCADAEGFLAPLVRCSDRIRNAASSELSLQFDPSGAPMCFAANGELASLDHCETAGDHAEIGYRFQADPSGAPMCFAANGELAPLSHCEAKHLVGLWASLEIFGSAN